MTALLWKTRLSGSSRRLPNFAKSSVRHRVTCLAALNCALTTIQKRIACAIPTASSTNASARMECGIGTGLWHWLRRRKMPISDFIIQGKEMRALMKRMGAQRSKAKTRKKSRFEVQWVKLPFRWIRILHEATVTGSTYDLALTILVESFRLEQMAVKEIVLSEKVTGLSKDARKKAVDNLVRLKLIKIKRGAGKAVRVIDLYI